jgi:hypothetical protein
MRRIACIVVLLSPALLCAAQADSPASQATTVRPDQAAGTWKVSALVGDTRVQMKCVIAAKELKLTGTCGVDQDDEPGAPRSLTGEVTDKGLAWHFDAHYEGKTVTVSMTAVLDDAGTKMYGSMEVSPLDANGTFLAEKQQPEAK